MTKKFSDEAKSVGLDVQNVAQMMIEKMEKLKTFKVNLIKEKMQLLSDTKRNYDLKIKRIEKDIYNFENSIKQLTGATEYHRQKAEYNRKKEQLKQKKSEEVSGSEETLVIEDTPNEESNKLNSEADVE